MALLANQNGKHQDITEVEKIAGLRGPNRADRLRYNQQYRIHRRQYRHEPLLVAHYAWRR